MNSKDYYLLVFESKNHSIMLFNSLSEGSKDIFQLVFAPCALKTGCSYAIKIPHKNYIYLLRKEMEKLDLSGGRLFFITKELGKIKYKEIPF